MAHRPRFEKLILLALKVILLDRLQGIICSGIQEPYLLGVVMLGRDRCPGARTSDLYLLCVCVCVCVSEQRVYC